MVSPHCWRRLHALAVLVLLREARSRRLGDTTPGGIPRRIVLWNAASATSCGGVQETRQAFLSSNVGFEVEAQWGAAETAAVPSGLAQVGRNNLVRDGLAMLRQLYASGGIYVSDASWPGEPMSAVLTADDEFVMGVAADAKTGERHLLFLAAAAQSPVMAAMVAASEAALRAPAETYQRMWADPLAEVVPADQMEERHFTGIAMMDSVLESQFAGAAGARVLVHDLKLVALPTVAAAAAGVGDSLCSSAAAAAAAAASAGATRIITPVFLNLMSERVPPGSPRGRASVSAVGVGAALAPGQYVAPARSSEAVAAAALQPMWAAEAAEAVPACAAAAHGCFLWLARDGQLALYAGMGLLDPAVQLVKVLSAAPTAGAGGSGRWLALNTNGDIVLFSSADGAAVAVWRAGSAFSAGCYSGECRSDVFLSVHDDGRLELRRRMSPAMTAYITVGAAANKRLSTCLWHNDFASEAVAIGGATVPPRAQPSNGADGSVASSGCQVPPALVLATFPNSGTSFTLRATQEATEHAVYTCYEHEVMHTHEDNAQLQQLCGFDAGHELGMCQLTNAARGELRMRARLHGAMPPPMEGGPPTPPPGKGALIKSHVADFGTGVFCGADGVERYRRALAQGANGHELERYGVLRLFRNPFDNMVARYHLLTNTEQLKGVNAHKAGFLADNGHIPKRDIYTYLYWHLNANVVLRELGMPVALLTYEDIYEDPVAYLRAVVSMLGWTEEE
ncbi:unnamed protein product, partial [Phaeothamnion confervicola]